MYANLAIMMAILICVAYQYARGGLVKSFVLFIAAVCASAVAFNFFELLGRFIVSRGYLVQWAQPIAFAVLFILPFAVLVAVADKLISKDVKFPLLIDKLGSAVFAILLGMTLSGIVIVAVALAPLSPKYPYQRFNDFNFDPRNPQSALLSPDGFVTSIFTSISGGSFAAQKSFAVLHPDFTNQLFLNRIKISDGVSFIARDNAITIPAKAAAWRAPQNLTNAATGEEISPTSNQKLTVVRIGFTPASADEKGLAGFTLSQIGLICRQQADMKEPFAGTAQSIYPIGYIKMPGKLRVLPLNTRISLGSDDLITSETGEAVRWIDFVFGIPEGYVPLSIAFKQNVLVEVPSLIPADEAPPPVTFIPVSECAVGSAQLEPVTSAKVYPLELTSGQNLLSGLLLPITDLEALRPVTAKLMAEGGLITYLSAKLVLTEEQQSARQSAQPGTAPFANLLKPLEGYQLLSLKCNNPDVGSPITANQLPVLVELSGKMHYPVGIIAAGTVDDQVVYQLDYCSLTQHAIGDGLVLAKDGSVLKAFAGLWLTAQAKEISELYLLYLVQPAGQPLITSVESAPGKQRARFTGCEGFLIK